MGTAEVVTALVQTGADPNARTEFGSTPLDVAAINGRAEVVMALVEAGADPMTRNAEDRTPWDLVQENDALKGSAAYWRMNDARFDAP